MSDSYITFRVYLGFKGNFGERVNNYRLKDYIERKIRASIGIYGYRELRERLLSNIERKGKYIQLKLDTIKFILPISKLELINNFRIYKNNDIKAIEVPIYTILP